MAQRNGWSVLSLKHKFRASRVSKKLTGSEGLPYDSLNQEVGQFIQTTLVETIPSSSYQEKLIETCSAWLTNRGRTDPINLLPLFSYLIYKKDSKRAIPVVAAWQLLRLSAKLVDDIEDQEVVSNVPEAIHLAISILFSTQLMLSKLNAPPFSIDIETYNQLTKRFHTACLRAGMGQHEDLLHRIDATIPDPETWLETARAKSGSILGWAVWAGAKVAEAGDLHCAALEKFGYHLGALLQIADDFYDYYHQGWVGEPAIWAYHSSL